MTYNEPVWQSVITGEMPNPVLGDTCSIPVLNFETAEKGVFGRFVRFFGCVLLGLRTGPLLLQRHEVHQRRIRGGFPGQATGGHRVSTMACHGPTLGTNTRGFLSGT